MSRTLGHRLRARLRTPLFRFVVVGGGAALLELSVFQVLVVAGLDPVPANVLSFLAGMTTSFVGYRKWSFAGEHRLPLASQFGAYFTLALVNSFASSAIIHWLVGTGTRPWVAKIICMALVATWNFLLLNRLIFRRGDTPPEHAEPAGTTPPTV
ncbi:hypothetical protein AGMMS50218_16910 [Actinomycetota bacterium]|nr:hypothetical protein AGMMS50218_16910 [Actinomycetota bacterium]